MATSDAQKRATERYRRQSVKQISVRFYPSEMELFAWAKSQDNLSGYIKGLIRADMSAREAASGTGDR